MINLKRINEWGVSQAKLEFGKCCGSTKWVEAFIKSRPFHTTDSLFKVAESIWYALDKKDWLEAFSHHPKIGDLNAIKEKFHSTKHFAEGEQAGVQNASIETLTEFISLNEVYEKKFGYIFIVCATGKPAEEMLAVLKERIKNNAAIEIKIAMEEQNKITKLRLEKIL